MKPPASTHPPATMPQGAIAVSGLSLRHNFAWTLAGNVVYAGCQWGMLIVLAKLGSPIMVGQFALGLAVTAPVIMFASLQLRPVQATDARREYEFGHYLGLRLVTTLLALLVIASISLTAGYRRETAMVVLAVGLAKAFESISDVFYGLLQQAERMDRIAISMMLKGPLSLAALGAGVYLTGSVFWGAIGLATTWCLLLITYDFASGRLILNRMPATSEKTSAFCGLRKNLILLPRGPIQTCGRLAWLSLPLGVVALFWSLNINIPNYFIEYHLGERELGIFAALAYLMVAGKTVVGALGQSSIARLAMYNTERNQSAFLQLLLKLIGLAALLGVSGILLVWLAGSEILTLLYSSDYAAQAQVLLWLVLAAGISWMATFCDSGMTALRYFRIQIPLFTLLTITTILACYWLIPAYGLRGAALAVLLENIVHLLCGLTVVLYAVSRHLKPYSGDIKESS